MKRIATLMLLLISIEVCANLDKQTDKAVKSLTIGFFLKDIQLFVNKDPSSLVEIETVKPADLIHQYKNNELKYENQYANKLVRILALVAGIKTDITSDTYIIAEGDNPLEFVSLYVDKNDPRIINLKKGDNVDMICRGKENNLFYPILSQCIFAQVYISNMVKGGKEYIDQLKPNQKPQYYLLDIIYNALIQAQLDNAYDANQYHDLYALIKDKKHYERVLNYISKETRAVKTKYSQQLTTLTGYYYPWLENIR